MTRKSTRLPLNALRTFEAAARRLSFKDAAEELFVSPTTVSNQIRQLEREWGIALFVRKTRAVVLTDAGRSIATVLARSFGDIRAEIDSHLSPVTKTVTLAIGPIFGTRWLTPRLERFRAKFPSISLVLEHSPRITSVETMSTQIAVDWGTGEWDGLEVNPLFSIRYSPVISPALIKMKGLLASPSDLARFPIVHQHDRSEWTAWLDQAMDMPVTLNDEIIVMDSNLAVQAAIDGQGVSLGTFPFLSADVAEGRLLKPFDTDLKPKRSYYLLTKPGARQDSDVDAVANWLVSEAMD